MNRLIFKEVSQRHPRVLIITGGESLAKFDFSKTVDFDGAIITVNNAVFHVPRSDYWITVDPMGPQRAMVELRKDCYYFAAVPERYGDPENPDHNFRYPPPEGIHYLNRIVPINGTEYDHGLCENKSCIKTGDSTYGAIGLAYHFEASRIAVLGWDGYGRGHWWDPEDVYDNGKPEFKKYLSHLPPIAACCVEQISKRGSIVNGSPSSKILAFPLMSPEDALAWVKGMPI